MSQRPRGGRGPFAVEVGEQREAVGAGDRAQRQFRESVVVDPEQPGAEREHPRRVDGAGEPQEAAGGVGEAGDRAGAVSDGVGGTIEATPEVPIESATSPGRRPSPRAAAMLSPVPGRSLAPDAYLPSTASAAEAMCGSRDVTAQRLQQQVGQPGRREAGDQ